MAAAPSTARKLAERGELDTSGGRRHGPSRRAARRIPTAAGRPGGPASPDRPGKWARVGRSVTSRAGSGPAARCQHRAAGYPPGGPGRRQPSRFGQPRTRKISFCVSEKRKTRVFSSDGNQQMLVFGRFHHVEVLRQ